MSNDQIQPVIFILFGATGDLSRKYLFPSLYQLYKHKHLPEEFLVIASGRSQLSNDEFLKLVFNPDEAEERDLIQGFTNKVTYLQGDLTDAQTFTQIAKLIDGFDDRIGTCSHKIFYCSISPSLYDQVIDGVTQTESLLKHCNSIDQASIVVEKPFGRDLASFLYLNDKLLKVFSEQQIYRIDHYLGKDTVQNILFFKNTNPIIDNDLNSDRLESVEILNYETVGVGTRASFYDNYGQLRDMLQSHVLQLLAIALVDTTEAIDPADIIQMKSEILNSLQIEDISRDVIRARYVANESLKLAGYLSEQGVSQDSTTETYVELKGKVNMGKWQGLKFRVVTGKRMPERLTQISLQYKSKNNYHNKIIFTIQPNEAIAIEFFVKIPGEVELQKALMQFNYNDAFSGLLPNAYENLLFDIINKRKAFFLSKDELEVAWKFVDPILEYWKAHPEDIQEYKAGELPTFS